jgi:hypothetical protein
MVGMTCPKLKQPIFMKKAMLIQLLSGLTLTMPGDQVWG